MELIDEEGQLFGVVNVIDALAVLLVLAVVVAGVALVNPFGSQATTEKTTRYATIELQDQPSYIAELFTEGDAMSFPETDGTITVTDVFMTPNPRGNVSVSIRVRINGTLRDDPNEVGETFLFGGRVIQQGGPVTIETGEFVAEGSVTRLSFKDPTLNTSRTPVSLTTTVSQSTARKLTEGESVKLAGREIAQIREVHIAPGTNQNNRRVRLIADLETLVRSGQLSFGGEEVVIGNDLALNPGGYRISGRIESIEDESIHTENTTVMVQTTVDPAVSERLEVGEPYRIGNDTVAEITSLQRFPAAGGDRHQLFVGLELETVVDDGDRYFGPTRLALGNSIPFRTDVASFSGRIESLDEPFIERATTPVTVHTTVDPAVSERLSVGETYAVGGDQVAEITSLQRFPAAGGDRHRLFVGLELKTVVDDGEHHFGATRLAIGNSIPFRAAAASFSGSIVNLGSDDLDPGPTDVAIETTVPTRVADEIAVGDEYRLAGAPVATVRSIETYPTGNQDRTHVVLGLELTTVDVDGDRFFGNSRVQLGSNIPFESDAYRLSGSVIGRDSLTPPGDTTTKRVVVKVSNVRPEFADGIRTGMRETSGEETTARIVNKRVESAQVILTSESGEIFERQHPRNVDVYLTVEVRVRDTRTGLRFHSRSLQEGNAVTLDFTTISVRGTVIEIR